MSETSHPSPPGITWASAVVALGVIAAVAAIAITAIVHYASVDDALKFWSALSGLIGIITGAMVTYFFSRGTVQSATADAAAAREDKNHATERADTASQALSAALLHVDPQKSDELLQTPSVSAALGMRSPG